MMLGYNFRAAAIVEDDGSYQFDTILPGRYLNGSTYRPSHIHVRVRWDDDSGSNDFISQLYFEGDPFLESDPWAEESRTLALREVRMMAGRRPSTSLFNGKVFRS